MIKIDTTNYDMTVRVWNDDRGILFDLDPALCDRGRVGKREVAALIVTINRALERLQMPAERIKEL